jgi:hypothetical protein
MNQSNVGRFAGDSGVYQDGALLLHVPAQEQWVATLRVQLTPQVTLPNGGGVIRLLDAGGLKVDGVFYTREQAAEAGRRSSSDACCPTRRARDVSAVRRRRAQARRGLAAVGGPYFVPAAGGASA